MKKSAIAMLAIALAAIVAGFGGFGKEGSGFGRLGAVRQVGIPLWVVNPANTPDVDFNFALNQAWKKSGGLSTAASLLTVSRASTGYVNDNLGNWTSVSSNLPRLSNLGLLVEEARTNRIPNNSMQGAVAGVVGSGGSLPTGWLINSASGLTTTVNGVGTESGIDYIEVRLNGTTAGTSYQMANSAGNSVAALNNDTWTQSLFHRLVAGSLTNVADFQSMAFVNNNVPSFLTTLNVAAANPTNAALGTQRRSLTATISGQPTTAFIQQFPVFIDFSNGVAIDLTIRIGWPQLELGASVTSPIRTTSAAVLRAADVVTMTTPPTFGAAYSGFLQFTPQPPTGYALSQSGLSLNTGSTSQQSILRSAASGGVSTYTGTGGTGFTLTGAAWTKNIYGKIAGSAAAGTQNMAFNGTLASAGSAASLPTTPIQVNIGSDGAGANQANGFISQAAIWASQSVPNAQLQAITTVPPQFFVATAGSDSNAGTATLPWQTISKVNSSASAGSEVYLNGGDSFATTTGITADVSVASYGTFQATISSGNSAPCISNTNPAGARSINLITCTGGGLLTNSTDGILYSNTTSGSLSGPSITNVTLSGYGGNGVHILAGTSCFGFNNSTISGNTIHDVSGTVTANSTAAINIGATPSSCYGNGAQSPSFNGATANNNNIYNIPGALNTASWSGMGISFAEVNGGMASGNTISNIATGSNHCGGSSGILLIDGSNLTAQFNSIYDIDYAAGGCDGNGIDISDNLINVLVQYNYVKNPGDHCFLLTNYNDSQHAFSNVTVRFNVCQNPKYQNAIALELAADPSGTINIYNNTLVNQVPGTGTPFSSTNTNPGSVTATVANNILIGNPGANLVSVTVPSSINFYGNDYYSYGSGLNFSWNGTTYTSFAAWQTATGQEKIAGSNVGLTSNPQIYVPGGGWDIPSGSTASQLYAYYLQSGSPMVGAGVNLQTQFGINPGSQDFYSAAVSSASLPVGASAGDFGTFAASCIASSNFLARVSGFTKFNQVNYNSILCGMNDDGDLALIDGLWVHAAPNSAAALLNLVSTNYSLTVNGSITFTANVGAQGDGSTGFYNTAFNPATATSPKYALNSATVASYILTNRTTVAHTATIGAQNSLGNSGDTMIVPFDTSGHSYGTVNEDNSGVWPASTTTAQGLHLVLRGGASSPYQYWINGVLGSSPSIASVAVPNQNFSILAITGTAVVRLFSTDQVAATLISGAVNASHTSQRLNSFMTADGINVY